MLFLGIDTSTPCGSIALAEPGKIHAEWALNVPKTHAGRLLQDIQSLFRLTGIGLDQVDGIAVTTGPGSFTGLRIGLATAKTMALVNGKPLVGIPSLDVLVENVPYAPGLICAVLDARKGEIFTALYRKDAQGETKRLTDYLAVTPEALLEKINEPALFLGDGIKVYEDFLEKGLGQTALFAPQECHIPRASVLCRLAFQRMTSEGASHPRDLKALYVRASDAELKREAWKLGDGKA